MTAHTPTFPAGPTLEALRIERDAYAASEGEATVVYDKLRDELVVAKQRLSDQEKVFAPTKPVSRDNAEMVHHGAGW
jgi:hypothetical protein